MIGGVRALLPYLSATIYIGTRLRMLPFYMVSIAYRHIVNLNDDLVYFRLNIIVNAYQQGTRNPLFLARMVSKGLGQMGELRNGAEIYEVG